MSSSSFAANRRRVLLRKLTADEELELLYEIVPVVRQWCDVQRKFNRLPGLAMAIAYGDEPLAHLTSGATNVLDPLPITPDTVFRFNSASKLHTAMIAMKFAATGHFDLEWKLGEIISNAPEALRKRTMRQLLSHSADLRREGGILPWDNFAPVTLDELYGSTGLVESDKPPGTVPHYTNAGAMWIGQVLQAIANRSYEEIARACLIEPLHLGSHSDLKWIAVDRSLAHGHHALRKKNPGPLAPLPHVLADAAAPGYGWHGSISDLLAIGIALQSVATEEVRDTFFKRVFDRKTDPHFNETFTGIGCGVSHYTIGGHHFIGHAGGGYGHSSLVLTERTPAHGWRKPLTIAIVANSPFEVQKMVAGLVALANRALEAGRSPHVADARARLMEMSSTSLDLIEFGTNSDRHFTAVGNEPVVFDLVNMMPVIDLRLAMDGDEQDRVNVTDDRISGYRGDSGRFDPETGITFTGNRFLTQQQHAKELARQIQIPKRLAAALEHPPHNRIDAGSPNRDIASLDSNWQFTVFPSREELVRFSRTLSFTLGDASDVLDLWKNATTPRQLIALRDGMQKLRNELIESSLFRSHVSRLYHVDEFSQSYETKVPYSLLEAAAQVVVVQRVLIPRPKFRDVVDLAFHHAQAVSSPFIHAMRLEEEARQQDVALER